MLTALQFEQTELHRIKHIEMVKHVRHDQTQSYISVMRDLDVSIFYGGNELKPQWESIDIRNFGTVYCLLFVTQVKMLRRKPVFIGMYVD